jgi:hypothetical protein
MSISSEPYQCGSRIPLPMLFACLKQQLACGQLNEAYKLLSFHIDKKKAEKAYILIYNLTKVHELLGQESKRIFYLETLLKEEPFFPEAVYDLAQAYSTHLMRTSAALSLIRRHVESENSNNPFIQAAFLTISFAA